MHHNDGTERLWMGIFLATWFAFMFLLIAVLALGVVWLWQRV